jgi:hypothetical protein
VSPVPFSIIAIQMAGPFGGINSLAVRDVRRRAYQPSSGIRLGSHAYRDICRADKNKFDLRNCPLPARQCLPYPMVFSRPWRATDLVNH